MAGVSRYPSPGNHAMAGAGRGSRSDGSIVRASAGSIRRAGYPQAVSLRTRAVSSARCAGLTAHSIFPAGRYQAAPPSRAASRSQARRPAALRSW